MFQLRHFTNSNTNRYEHDFLSKNKTFEVWMNNENDCGMVGELVHACLCLGIAEDNESNPPMTKAREWLLSKQREDGGWLLNKKRKRRTRPCQTF